MNKNMQLLSVNNYLSNNNKYDIYANYNSDNKVSININNSTKQKKIATKINNYIDSKVHTKNDEFSLSEVKTISHGRFAQVCLAVDNKTNQQYAFKRFFSSKDIANELRFFQQVDKHPNIVECFGIAKLHENYGLVLSYIDGSTLNHLTKYLSNKYINKELSHSGFWGITQHIFYHILLGLQHIHRYNFAHQDLKPTNIIFDKTKLIPIIIDFNVSHIRGEVLSPGKEEYASPEFFTSNGTAKVSEITDSYSIGQLLYQVYFSTINPATFNTFLAGAKTEDLTSKDRVIMLLRMRTAFREYIKLNDHGRHKTAIKALPHKEILKLRYNSSSDDDNLQLNDAPQKSIDHNGENLVGYYHESYETAVVQFINACMHPNPDSRLTADEALQHPFITDRIISTDKVKSLLALICSKMIK